MTDESTSHSLWNISLE